METIAGFADSYEISNTSSTSFFAAPAPNDNIESSVDNPAGLPPRAETSAFQLLSSSLESVFDSPEEFYSDAKLVLADEREISFHRCILSGRSPFFKIALAAAEKEQKSGAVKLELKEIAKDYEVGFDSVVAVLAYIYSGRVRPPPKGVSECADENCFHVACRPAVDFRVEVLYLAFLFEIPEVITMYEGHLLGVVDKVIIEDTLVILKLANICGKACEKLLDKCREIIVESNVDLVSLNKSLPQHIVKQIVDTRKELGLEAPEPEKHVSNIHKALESDDIALVNLLLTEGHTNLDDAYALHFAVAYCDVKTATDLLELKLADVNRKNPRGYTVLHVAAMRKEPSLIAFLLTEGGANASETSFDGRTALVIAKQVAKAADYNYIPEEGESSPKGRVCIEILEQANKHVPFLGDVYPSLAVAADELRMRLLDLENRVQLAQCLFPMEARVAMEIAQMKGTCEFVVTSLEPERLTGAKRTAPDLYIAPFKILEEHRIRLRALSKTVELGKRFFPRCSGVLDHIMDCEDLSVLACIDEDTPEKRIQKKQRYMEIQETLQKAFTEDKEEYGKSSLSASSSSTSKSTATKRSNNGKPSHRRR
uniref:Regulatory protein NPR1 n=1 Tax=Noccaea caerulescens TaxID=107243 RepID=A0A1J3CVK1_NOCCA